MSLVLDASVTLAWIYPGERTGPMAALFDRVTEAGAWVPSLWHLEIANSLQMGIRRGRIDAAFRDKTLADLELLSIQTDPDTQKQAWPGTVQLAERHRLTMYDAAYLELAIRRNLGLASLDGELRAAAIAESVAPLGE